MADASILETPTRMTDRPADGNTAHGTSAKRTKICVVGLRGVPGVMGGIESHCEQIFPRLKRLNADYDITIIGRRPYVSGAPYAYEGLRVVPLPAARSKYLEAITNTALAVLYARFYEKADVIHIHGIGPALMGPLARLLGMKLVVTHHGQDFARAKWNSVAKAVLRLGEQCAVRAAHRVIVVSKSVTEELRRQNRRGEARIEYIPNGATELPADPLVGDGVAPLEALGLTPGGYILAVGRLVPEKAFHLLIDAYRVAKPGYKLAIVGRADHDDDYSRQLLAKAGGDVIFCGFQNHGTLRALYQHAALFVLPSTHEGLPIAALEAAKLGVPMVLSDIQANVDIGLAPDNYFRSGNVHALAAKLGQDYQSFAVDAQEIGRRFDWGAITEATQKVYAQLAAA
ncbi:glycosyltransferase family 4 protein [Dongia rigui]|uniref:Glycosyltransferase family 4 protein n=1 Tax=Dongia rigui TaxID=940149 RepID=A0ABU5DZ47_9PROT|nr:glycosyltransferase family 4 protein [Dongia rigui]MDY0872559.1 glycosyltransferase family 4 protein [Dongia rigui]